MYKEWRAHHHSLGLEFIPCDLEDKATITASSLKFSLCRFIMEVKKIDGTDFPGKTLYDIVICVQFHLECLGLSFKLINDDAFCDLKYTLDNTMKIRVASGIGISVKEAEILSATDEDYLWSLGFLGISNPQQLLNTVVFCVRKAFALRAGKEHQALRAIPFNSQFKFLRDSDNEIYLQYTEDIDLKTNKGGLKHKKVNVKSVDLYAMDRPERCPLCVILRYMSLLPKSRSCTAFYLQPQNHSLRSMAMTKMYQKNFDEQLIMEITGHRSLAVRAYKRTSQKQRKLANQCIFSD